MDNDVNIGIISLFHVENIKQCIYLAEKEGKHRAYVMLSLIAAALSGNMESINHLSLKPASEKENQVYSYLDEYFDNDPLSLIHCGLFSINVSSKVPIEIAQQNNRIKIVNKLLLMINVCPDEGQRYVYWVGLQLQTIHIALLQKINWVKRLRLSRNKLTTLPEDLDYCLGQVLLFIIAITLCIHCKQLVKECCVLL